MKKTVRVNISGFIFNIDEDAYNKLRHYLDDINRRFLNTEEGKEVIADVEARIAELFQQKVSENKEVIDSEDVNYVISILGRPEDFVGSEEADPEEPRPIYKENSSRRLYRDTDNRMLGGVCPGLGYYFGIDPVIFRILFIVTFFGWGGGLLVYLILWIVVPSARTTAQKLEMKGEPITLTTIERSIKDEFQGVKSNFQNINSGKTGDRIRQGSARTINAVSGAAEVFLRVFVIFIGAILILAGLSAIFGMITAIFIGNTVTLDHVHTDLTTLLGLVATPGLATWAIISASFLLLIPMVFIVFLGLKLIFRFEFGKKYIGISALGLWLIALGSSIIVGVSIGQEFRASNTVTTVTPLTSFKSDTLYLASFIPEGIQLDNDEDQYHDNDFMLETVNGKLQIYNTPRVSVEKSESNQFEIVQHVTARGSMREIARKYAANVKYQWNQKDSLLNLSRYFSVDEGNKFRAQSIKIKIRIPVGKVLIMKESSRPIIYDIQNTEDEWDGNMMEMPWIMRPYGLSKLNKDNLDVKPTPDDPTKDEVTKLKEELKAMKAKQK